MNNDNSARVNRGGSWLNSTDYARAAPRGRRNPGLRDDNLGFRLARVITSLQQLSEVCDEYQ